MKKLLAILLIMMLVLSFAACSGESAPAESAAAESTPAESTTGEEAEAPAMDVLVYGTSPDYPPFEFRILEDGQDTVVGIDVSLAYQIAEDMGTELQITDMSFDTLLNLMAKGECDMVIAAMETTPERENAATPSDPYYTDLPAMILVKEENIDQFTSFESFDGLSVGAQSGTTKADMIGEFMPGATALLIPGVTDLINSLTYDKCSALILDGAVALQYAEAHEGLAVIEVEEMALGEALPYCVWVEKDDPKGLLPSINATIAKVLEDGSMDAFIEEANELSSSALE